MDGLFPVTDETTADVFIRGEPYQITLAFTYVRLKHLAAWGARIRLHDWDSWDNLGERLGERLGRHIWHPSHWDAHYAAMTDVPASTPGATPQTLKMAREQGALDLFAHGQED